jgi:hypothetical protein
MKKQRRKNLLRKKRRMRNHKKRRELQKTPESYAGQLLANPETSREVKSVSGSLLRQIQIRRNK